MTPDSTTRIAFRARWVIPVSGPPVENGTVEIVGNRISGVHSVSDPSAIDLGNVALIPSLVNCHTHLEFSDLPAPVAPPSPFTSWIRSLMGVRRSRTASDEILRLGLKECASTGSGLVGEIATTDWNPCLSNEQNLDLVVFRELIGITPERASEQTTIAENWLTAAADDPRFPRMRRGISPHAPYTVYPDLYSRLIDIAADKQSPVAVHLAETRSEIEFLMDGRGEFVELFQSLGVWNPHAVPKGTRILDYLTPLAKTPCALVIHGNYLDTEEIRWLAKHDHVSVVYCPRTHAYFRHSPHPFPRLQEEGVRVVIGTDSRGSNPDLNLWRELCFLRSLVSAPSPAKCLEMGTLTGAKALGLHQEMGCLLPDRRAALTVVNLEPGTSRGFTDPFQLLFASDDLRPLDLTGGSQS